MAKQSASDLFEGFHGRQVRENTPAPKLPSEFKPVGRLIRLWYESDKRDPGDPHGDGRQGIKKVFYHDTDSKPTLYVSAKKGDYTVTWPEYALRLGNCLKLEMEGGRLVKLKNGAKLCCSGDGDFAFIFNDPKGKVLLIHGGRFHVEPRGLVY